MSSKKNNGHKEKEKKDYLDLAFAISALIGFVGLIGYSYSIFNSKLFFIILMISLSSFGISFFIGVLFGMPKRKDNDSASYTLNNSLVEISEWLTKIIVGISLVNLINIPPFLRKFGDYVASSTDSDSNSSIEIMSVSTVVYFGFLGLFFGYNYMRIFLSLKYREVDNLMVKEIEDLKHEIEEKDKAVHELDKDKNTAKDLLSRYYNKLEVDESILRNLDSELGQKIESLKLKAEEKTGINQKFDETDPQKGKWGEKSINNNKVIEAEVNELFKGLYKINIKVRSLDPLLPLHEDDIIIFALHPTFIPKIRLVKVKNGSATLELIAYGSFTVGAFADYEGTELELDLSQLPGVSEYFRTH